jgi:hypothetical protein
MSLVQELQRDALSSAMPISELLRKALVVARKLGVRELADWLGFELKGYPKGEDVPPYRVITGRLMAENPVRGWVPVHLDDCSSGVEEALTNRGTLQPVSEIESVIEQSNLSSSSKSSFSIYMMVPADIQKRFQGDFGWPIALHTSVSELKGILDAVRNIVLEWSL